MTPTPQQTTAMQLLRRQTQLLENSYELQTIILRRLQERDEAFAKWMHMIAEEQREQRRILKNMSTLAKLLMTLVVLGLAIWFCSAAGLR